MSRSLVGSSSTSTFAGRANSRASSRRLRSPPESMRTGESARSRREQEVAEVAHHVLAPAADLDPLGAGADGVGDASSPGRAPRASGRSRRPARWRRGARVPASGSSSPRISLSSVVLPAPFGPIRPTLVAAHARARSKSLDDRSCSPKRFRDVLRTRRRACRSARRRRSRASRCPARRAARRAPRAAAPAAARGPSLRVRRASTPLRIQTSSCAQNLSNLRCVDRLGRELLGLAAPRRRRSCPG